MPTYEFMTYLADSAMYTVLFITSQGRVRGFIVRLRAQLDGCWYEVRRYDTAHGTPHVDVLNWRGTTIEKLWLPQLTPPDALTFAIEDIKANYNTYIRRFLA